MYHGRSSTTKSAAVSDQNARDKTLSTNKAGQLCYVSSSRSLSG